MTTPRTSWIQEIRQRLLQPPPTRLPAGEGRRAAVLVPLYVDAGELWTVLTQRSHDLPHHKGQFAFPGGGHELGEDDWTAALRETHEELGIDPSKVLRLGELDELPANSGYRIVPCVGAIPFPFETEINRGEIADVFNVPVSALANPRMIEDREVLIDGTKRQIRLYHVGSRRVWGLTAQILQNLLIRLGLEIPEI
jgi:8-oxo-dGTP pyrophosphatase MutT (NUDIX family)